MKLTTQPQAIPATPVRIRVMRAGRDYLREGLLTGHDKKSLFVTFDGASVGSLLPRKANFELIEGGN